MPKLVPKLAFGDTIGFFSPSSPATHFAPARFERAVSFVESKGFRLLAGSLTGKKEAYRSGAIRERAEELNALIRNPAVKCIISTIGGQNSNSILPYIDYKSFAASPKILIGYSDVTAILLGVYAQTGYTTFYGPALVASFGEPGYFVEATFRYFQEVLMGDTENVPHEIRNPIFWTDDYIPWEAQTAEKSKHKNELVTITGGRVEGRLIVGNLNTISGIYGSEYMPPIEQGDILVIEDSLKGADNVERLFSHLKINGIFEKLGGLVLGKHEKFNDLESGKRPYEILMEVMGNTTMPFLAEYDCCHTHPMITLPIGVRAELDATGQTLTLTERWIN